MIIIEPTAHMRRFVRDHSSLLARLADFELTPNRKDYSELEVSDFALCNRLRRFEPIHSKPLLRSKTSAAEPGERSLRYPRTRFEERPRHIPLGGSSAQIKLAAMSRAAVRLSKTGQILKKMTAVRAPVDAVSPAIARSIIAEARSTHSVNAWWEPPAAVAITTIVAMNHIVMASAIHS